MKKILIAVLALVSWSAYGAGSGFPLYDVQVDISDKASLQRGAKYYVNYCMGCHSLGYLRYNRLGRDLGLTDREVEENLIFTQDEEGSPTKVGELMTMAMDKFYAEKAFGVVPPDLTLVARTRPHGPAWLYTYLLTFYLDENQQWGVNNALFPNVGMPHALWDLQGWQKPVYEEQADKSGQSQEKVIVGFETVQPGALSEQEYEQVVKDLTNFLTYAAEPAKMQRHKLGVWVLAFLFIFAGVAYILKKEYWADIK